MPPDGVADAKRRLRQRQAAARRAVSPDVALAAGRAVAQALLREPRVRQAGRVALYAAAHGELPSRPIFEALGELSVTRLLPRLRGDTLEWAPVQQWDELVAGRFDILEPPGPATAAPGAGDVVLLPGLAFDAAGHRLGRGGGHYDRAFPPGGPGPWLIGVGYAFQCLAAVPHDSRDRRVDAIVTERGLVWVPQAEVG